MRLLFSVIWIILHYVPLVESPNRTHITVIAGVVLSDAAPVPILESDYTCVSSVGSVRGRRPVPFDFKLISAKSLACCIYIKYFIRSFSVCVNLEKLCKAWQVPAACIGCSQVSCSSTIVLCKIKCWIFCSGSCIVCCPTTFSRKECFNLFKVVTAILIPSKG